MMLQARACSTMLLLHVFRLSRQFPDNNIVVLNNRITRLHQCNSEQVNLWEEAGDCLCQLGQQNRPSNCFAQSLRFCLSEALE